MNLDFLVALIVFNVSQLVSSVAKTPLYIGSMSPMTGKSAWWGRGIPVAAEMAFQLINNRQDILPGYELQLLANDTQGDTGLGNRILYDYLSNRKILMVLGPSRSNVALSVASTARYWNLIQVSASATSSDLSKSSAYPDFFRTIPSLGGNRKTFVALARRFNWTRVAILFYSRDMQEQASRELKDECSANNITVLSYGSYLDGDDADNQIKHLKDIDVRVVFGYVQRTTTLFCKIYKHGMYGSKYAWVINTPDNKTFWWQRTFPNTECTAEQIREAAEYTITIDDLLIGDGKERGVSGLSPQEFQHSYSNFSETHGLPVSMFGPLAFDTAWLMALALNRTARELGPNISLDQFYYKNTAMSELMKKSLLDLEFAGVTGNVHLESNGDRQGNFEVAQIQGKTLEVVAIHHVSLNNLTVCHGNVFIWRGGRPPADHVTIVTQLLTFSTIGFIVVCACASLGIALSIGFLYFNVVYRQRRFIKMSSPNLNNLIILGCILAYVSVILFCVDGDELTDLICEVRVFTLDIGFTLGFGAMFAKTWRVHRITRKLRLKRRVLKDIHLVAMVMLFLAVDLVVLLLWLFLDPLKKDHRWLNVKSQRSEDMIYRYKIASCRASNMFIWLTALYGFKVLLLLFGLFLAWETRKVKITALNDSHHIGMAVYNVFIVCIIGVPITLILNQDMHQETFVISTLCIMSCTTLTICLVFVPKIRRLLKCKNSMEEHLDDIPSFKIRFGGQTLPCACECHQRYALEGHGQSGRSMGCTEHKNGKEVHTNNAVDNGVTDLRTLDINGACARI